MGKYPIEAMASFLKRWIVGYLKDELIFNFNSSSKNPLI
jgi:hypothetical protein